MKTLQIKPEITVVMASYLGDYPNAATGRVAKFHRAVDSVFADGSVRVELIIVSDGCEITNQEVTKIKHLRFTRMVYLTKQEMFSGMPRNAGIESASAPLVCYLDTDDIFLPGHLRAVVDGFRNGADWVYFDDYVAAPNMNPPVKGYMRGNNPLVFGFIGTSSIAHRASVTCRWPDGYGHDWKFIEQLVAKYPNYKKIGNAGYLVCHLPAGIDV